MNNIFEIAENCLTKSSILDMLEQTHRARQADLNGKISLQNIGHPKPISATRFPAKPVLLPPRRMPRRGLSTTEGIAAFFHALAHIEFVAIYLAWDIIYRFRSMPERFYRDWLRVADEEARHFTLLREHLMKFGIDYGDLPAHGGLWEHAIQTSDDLLARLAMVPRCMEARGLDVTPAMIDKFKAMNDEQSVAILTRILNDEIGHVKLGSDWFVYQCRHLALEPDATYRKLLTRFLQNKPKGPFNKELRLTAGFTEAELDWLEHE
ncbi:MAG: ferritin-like domain-containing protein [Gammaproteobacteria bacterium]